MIDLVFTNYSRSWVQTEMGNHGAKSNGMEKAPVTVEDSVSGMLSKVETLPSFKSLNLTRVVPQLT